MSHEIKLLKAGRCSSLSGRSELKFEIGCKVDKSIHVRLTENYGAGKFSSAWVSLAQIILLLSEHDKPISSRTIQPLYKGSVNSAGFLLAVLKDLGLIQNIEENSRSYICTDPKKLTAEIQALLEGESQSPKKKKSVVSQEST